jgi:hypothetical protein
VKKKTILLSILIIILLGSNAYLLAQYIKYKSINEYHRSRMFEYELLANLNRIFPVGTPLEQFLSEFRINKSGVKKYNDGKSYISFKPSMRIPVDEQRDFTGFTAVFEDGNLVIINPSGPDPWEIEIDINKLPFASKINYYN